MATIQTGLPCIVINEDRNFRRSCIAKKLSVMKVIHFSLERCWLAPYRRGVVWRSEIGDGFLFAFPPGELSIVRLARSCCSACINLTSAAATSRYILLGSSYRVALRVGVLSPVSLLPSSRYVHVPNVPPIVQCIVRPFAHNVYRPAGLVEQARRRA
jgi:hypothetical protein